MDLAPPGIDPGIGAHTRLDLRQDLNQKIDTRYTSSRALRAGYTIDHYAGDIPVEH